MSRPRDLLGYERSQAHREAIRQVMLEHARSHPLRRPLTGLQIQGRIPFPMALSTILWHVKAIHAEAEKEASRDLLESF